MKSGQLIADRYEIRGILGRGGMGEVYLAYDHRLATDVALKRVPLELALEPAVRDALVREARILARLSHTYIVRLFDLADTVDGLFLVLEYVCGPSLDKVLLQRKTLSAEELQHVMDHVSQGLTRAHSLGVVHRDLKPSNLLVALAGDERRYYLRDGTIPATLLNAEIKVTDFGLAKVVRQSHVNASGVISGTPGYMAPEQFRGELPSVETDVYALGFVAYVCLAGKLPIGDAEPLFFHLFVTPPPLAGVPAHMGVAIQKAIRKERADRFSSVAEFVEALHRPIAAPTPATPPPLPFNQPPLSQTETPAADSSSNQGLAKFLKVWLVAVGVLSAIIVVFVWAGILLSRNQSAAPKQQSTGTGTTTEQSAELPPLAPLNPAPRIDAPPPVIEQARLTVFPYPLPHGVERPEILAHARITGDNVFGFGPDGTLYVTDSERSKIGAFRDNQLVWQYQLTGGSGRFSISPDGLIWIHFAGYENRLYCFNAVGQGGELMDHASKLKYLPMVSKLEETSESAVQCVSPGGTQRDPAIEMFAIHGGRPWRTALDYGCQHDPTFGRSGKILVQTQARTTYLLSKEGQVLWTYAASCFFTDLMLSADDTAIGRCDTRKGLLGIRDGRQIFSITSGYRLSEPLGEDKDGNFYRFVDSDVYDRRTLIKSNRNGLDVWEFNLRFSIEPKFAISPGGKIYLLSNSPDGASVLVIGDRLQ